MTPIELFSYFITERENTRLTKEAGFPPPWSSDPILQKYHFCNIHREHDRGTRDIANVWRNPYQNSPNIVQVMSTARAFNWAPTLLLIGNPFSDWREKVKAERRTGRKIFHPAYVVSTCGWSLNKVDYVYELQKSVASLVAPFGSCKELYDRLRKKNGYGSFFAAQIVADVKHTPALEGAPDSFSFVAHGPGSMKGINEIIPTTPKTFVKNLDTVREALQHLGNPHIHSLDNQDLQNCLCEFSKYMRYMTASRGRTRFYRGAE